MMMMMMMMMIGCSYVQASPHLGDLTLAPPDQARGACSKLGVD